MDVVAYNKHNVVVYHDGIYEVVVVDGYASEFPLVFAYLDSILKTGSYTLPVPSSVKRSVMNKIERGKINLYKGDVKKQ